MLRPRRLDIALAAAVWLSVCGCSLVRSSADAQTTPQPRPGDRGFLGATQLAAPHLIETRIGDGSSHPVYYLRAVRIADRPEPEIFARINVGSHWGAEGRLVVRGARDAAGQALSVYLVEDSDGDGGLSQYRDLYVPGYVYETVDVAIGADHLRESGNDGAALILVGETREVGPLRFDARYIKRFLDTVEEWPQRQP